MKKTHIISDSQRAPFLFTYESRLPARYNTGPPVSLQINKIENNAFATIEQLYMWWLFSARWKMSDDIKDDKDDTNSIRRSAELRCETRISERRSTHINETLYRWVGEGRRGRNGRVEGMCKREVGRRKMTKKQEKRDKIKSMNSKRVDFSWQPFNCSTVWPMRRTMLIDILITRNDRRMSKKDTM